jgi:hypothetical protein
MRFCDSQNISGRGKRTATMEDAWWDGVEVRAMPPCER